MSRCGGEKKDNSAQGPKDISTFLLELNIGMDLTNRIDRVDEKSSESHSNT